MKTRRLLLFPVAVFCAALFAPAAGADEPGKWISMFDGKTLKGWSVYHGKWKPERSWVAEKGELYLKTPIDTP